MQRSVHMAGPSPVITTLDTSYMKVLAQMLQCVPSYPMFWWSLSQWQAITADFDIMWQLPPCTQLPRLPTPSHHRSH